MKKIFLFLFIIAAFSGNAQQPAGSPADEEAIRTLIQTAYVEGLQNEGDTVKINRGFHPGFEMLMAGKGGTLEKYSIAEWKKRIRTSLAEGKLPRREGERISVRFQDISVNGNAAVARFEFYAGTRLAFIDYLMLYKYEEGWKIVGKIYAKIQN